MHARRFALRASRPRTRRGGFTLIELLAAVAILMMIVGLMAMLFQESNRSWMLGTNRAENNNSGRAALQLMTHDMQYAVADDLLSFALINDATNVYDDESRSGFGCDELRFVSLENDSHDQNRTAREVYYYVSSESYNNTDFPFRYALMRGSYSSALTGNDMDKHCYHNIKWYDEKSGGPSRPSRSESAVVAENIAGFAVYVPDPKPDAKDGAMVREYYSDEDVVWSHVLNPGERFEVSETKTNKVQCLPPYADIYLEVLDEDAAKQLSEMRETHTKPKNESVDAFVQRNSRRYTTRVYFENGNGYRDGLRLARLRAEEK